MGLTPPTALPPVIAEYTSTLQQAGSHGPGTPSSYRFSRATNGMTRVDSGNTSVISNPAAGQTIVLDHLKQTATIQPTQLGPPPPPPNPGMPKLPNIAPPALPGLPQVPPVKVEDLGKTLLQGHEVEGKRFITPPPAPGPPLQMPVAPKIPQMPGAPPALAAPKLPGAPPPPAMPQMPGTPPAPAATTEVWTSTSMGVPMVTKISGSFGQLTQVCKKTVAGEPHPSTFQIPPGFKVLKPGA